MMNLNLEESDRLISLIPPEVRHLAYVTSFTLHEALLGTSKYSAVLIIFISGLLFLFGTTECIIRLRQKPI
jgi:hypothetical protein